MLNIQSHESCFSSGPNTHSAHVTNSPVSSSDNKSRQSRQKKKDQGTKDKHSVASESAPRLRFRAGVAIGLVVKIFSSRYDKNTYKHLCC